MRRFVSGQTTMMSAVAPLLEIKHLSMAYGAQRVLDDLNLEVYPNEVVGLVGENGAGKSTLLNILSGVTHGYAGDLIYGGVPLQLKDPRHASLKGIARVFQDQAIVPNLPVYENMLLSHESHFSRFGILRRAQQVAAARSELSALGLKLDPRRLAGECDLATRQAIEIARACSLSSIIQSEHRLILLDEPTASLSLQEIEPFFELVRRLKRQSAFIFVSHRLSEALDLCDRIYVLKDGAVMASTKAESLDVGTLHELMVGRQRDEDFYREDLASPSGSVVLRVDNLAVAGVFHDVSLDVRRGEVVSVVGVLGSGKSALGEAVTGLRRPTGGSVLCTGRDVTQLGFRPHLRLGFGYVPGDRALFGIVGTLSGRANITLSSLFDTYSRYGLLDVKAERSEAKKWYTQLGVSPPEIERDARYFSGGNQQKLLLSRAVSRYPVVLVLDNPTAGVDAGVKAEIYLLFRRLAADGCAILLITDDLLEAIGVGDRVAIMKDGTLREVIDTAYGSKPSERAIVQHMV